MASCDVMANSEALSIQPSLNDDIECSNFKENMQPDEEPQLDEEDDFLVSSRKQVKRCIESSSEDEDKVDKVDTSNKKRKRVLVDSVSLNQSESLEEDSVSDKPSQTLEEQTESRFSSNESDSDHETSAKAKRTVKLKRKRDENTGVLDIDGTSDEDGDIKASRSSRKLDNVTMSSTISTNLDPELFDAEGSDGGNSKRASGSEEESEDEVVNKLSSKYSGPAGKKQSKSSKRATQRDDMTKIYSEKQRMLREQKVTVPVYEPPKKSLRQFLSEQAPQLLKALRHPPKDLPPPKDLRHSKDLHPPKELPVREITVEQTASVKELYETFTNRELSDESKSHVDTVLLEDSDTVPVEQPAIVPLEDPVTVVDSSSAMASCTTSLKEAKSMRHEPSKDAYIADDDGDEDLPKAFVCVQEEGKTNVVEDDGISCQESAQDTVEKYKSTIRNKPIDHSSSAIVVKSLQVAKDKSELKKEKLRKMLGDSVDLDIVPQLTCSADGLVILGDDKLEDPNSRQLQQFRESFEKKVDRVRRLEEQKRKQREKNALKCVRDLPDGSHHELSMDPYLDRPAEETGGVHKLAVLKQILQAKLAERRGEEYKRKAEMLKLEALEEELPEDEILDDDYEFSDEENDDGEETSLPEYHPADEDSEDASQPCDLEKDSELMKRVRAVLDSDDEDNTEKEKPADTFSSLRFNSAIEDSIERMLEMETSEMTSAPIPSSADLTQLPLGDSATNTQFTQDGITQANSNVYTQSLRCSLDENARDVGSLLGFNSTSGKALDSAPVNFSHNMFDTQQAENEVVDLCSGGFGGGLSQGSNVMESYNHESQPDTNSNVLLSQNTEVAADDKMTKVVSKRKQALQFSDEEESDEERDGQAESDVAENHQGESVDDEDEVAKGGQTGSGDELDSSDEDAQEDEEERDEEIDLTDGFDKNAEKPLFLMKPKQSKKQKEIREYMDEEAELSGSEAGSDEDLDIDERHDVLETEQGDLDDVGTEDQLRSQVGKLHLKQRVDEDARELMLMKEMLLPDGDLHSDSRRQRRFRWRNVDYGNDSVNRADDTDDESGKSGDEADVDPDVKALHEKLEKERQERQAWLKKQKDNSVLQDDSTLELKGSVKSAENTTTMEAGNTTKSFSFSLSSKKKPGYILGKSKKYLERFKELHKNIKTEQSGPTSARNLLFRPISKEDAESQQEMIWEKLGRPLT